MNRVYVLSTLDEGNKHNIEIAIMNIFGWIFGNSPLPAVHI